MAGPLLAGWDHEANLTRSDSGRHGPQNLVASHELRLAQALAAGRLDLEQMQNPTATTGQMQLRGIGRTGTNRSPVNLDLHATTRRRFEHGGTPRPRM